MQSEKFDDAFRRAWVTSSKKNQVLAFPCMLFRRGKPELQEAEKEGQITQRKCAMNQAHLKCGRHGLSIKE
jgi:hypothetical protein